MEITASLVFGPKMPCATEWYTIQSIFTPKRCPASSVLSPILFLLVMDPLLREMESLHLGLYLGASAHADDVRTLTSSLLCLKQQVDLVQDFASRNSLLLNIQKCEVMAASSTCNTGSVLCSLDRMI